ncbi:MAG: aspartate dehydrogenase [Candidatus Bathyarchaeia archaeon]|nr:aspartate dehydrogenase [Candidatus Bathyarchaeota archaeon]
MTGVGLVGCGAIGTVIAEAIDRGDAGNISLVVIYDIVKEKAERIASRLVHKPFIARSLGEVLENNRVEIVVEAASQEFVKEYAVKILNSGKDLLVMSVGALLDETLLSEIIDAAKKTGKKIYIPSGAIVGIDNIKSAALGRIEEIMLITRKPLASFRDSRSVKMIKHDLSSIKEPLVLYEGPAREAVKLFPQNINVAATLSLAGIGPDKTRVKIIADPNIKDIIHEIYVKGEFGEIYTRAVNKPFPSNPRTSYIAALSAIATLKRIASSIIIGT